MSEDDPFAAATDDASASASESDSLVQAGVPRDASSAASEARDFKANAAATVAARPPLLRVQEATRTRSVQGTAGREPASAVFEDDGGALLTRDDYALTSAYMSRRAAGDGTRASAVDEASMQVYRRHNFLYTETADGAAPRVTSNAFTDAFSNQYFLEAFAMDVSDTVPPYLNDEEEAALRDVVFASPRAHEETMLRTPHAGELACSAGDECMGLRLLCEGGGALLVAYLFPDEAAVYALTLEADGREAANRLPRRGTLCLVCLRDKALAAVEAQRAAHATRHGRMLVATLRNVTGDVDEYRDIDCIGPVESGWLGLTSCVVKLNLYAFRRHYDASTGIVYFPQTLPYPVAPSLGDVHAAYGVASAEPRTEPRAQAGF